MLQSHFKVHRIPIYISTILFKDIEEMVTMDTQGMIWRVSNWIHLLR